MKTFWFTLSIIVLIFCDSKAQNGKIIYQKTIDYPDSVTTPLITRSPRFQQVLDNTQTLDITYISGSLKIKGFVIQPKKAGKYPCIIYCRGGHEDFGETDLNYAAVLSDMADHGYVVIASQLRGSTGCEGKDEYGGADTADVINCIPALSYIPVADTSRIGIYGISRGGLNALQVLRSQKNIRAAVINSGFVDAFEALKRKDGKEFEKEVYERLIPNYKLKKREQLIMRSPVYWPEKICRSTPILLLQGSSDWRVNADGTLKLVQKFYKLKQPVRFILIEGGTHGLRTPLRDMQLYEWFDKYVKNKSPLPDMQPHGD